MYDIYMYIYIHIHTYMNRCAHIHMCTCIDIYVCFMYMALLGPFMARPLWAPCEAASRFSGEPGTLNVTHKTDWRLHTTQTKDCT